MIVERVESKVLRTIPLFCGLNESECRQLADISQAKEFSPGQVVIEQGQSSQNLWIVLEGKCEVHRFRGADGRQGEGVVLAVIEPFSHFGEMSFFHPAPHSANVRAQTDVKLLCIARRDFDDLIIDGCLAAYKLAYNAVESLADRLRRMDERVAELANRDNHAQHDHEIVPEWSTFREKLFKGWNL
jgi:CRP-like cAMP-binding protein